MPKTAQKDASVATVKKQGAVMKHIKKYWQWYAMMFIPIVYYIVFRYIPMFGNIIAFRRYRAGSSIFGDEWSGLKYFNQFMKDQNFWRAFKNTLLLNFKYLIISFPLTLIFALLLNEVKNVHFKKIVQTISYLPHFISMVIVAGMVREILSTSGPINILDEVGVVGHILDIVGDGDNAAAGDIRSFSVDLGDDVGGSAGRNGQGNLIGVVGVVNDGQFQMDVGGLLDGLKDALADPLVVHGIGGVVVEEHRVGDRLVRVEVLAVLIAEVRLVRSSGVGGSSAAIGVGACSRGAAGAAAGSQRQHHAGSQHEGCELFHVS